LITVLSDPDGPFGITRSTDYDALTSRIAVLGVALSRIESYVIEESTSRKLAHMPEGSPRKKEPVPLELVRAQLDAIHGKICTSASPLPALISQLIGWGSLRIQSTRVPPTLIDPELRGRYNASRCTYIINVQSSPRRVGN
jgi:hypothetical protein